MGQGINHEDASLVRRITLGEAVFVKAVMSFPMTGY